MLPVGSPQSFRSSRPHQSRGRGHARQASNESVASHLSTQSAPPDRPPPPTAPMYRAQSNALAGPGPGSKMAEDMAAAVAMAQEQMRRRSPPVSPSASLRHRRLGSADSDMSSIGSIMLGGPPAIPLPDVPESSDGDPFEFDYVLEEATLDSLTETYLSLPDEDRALPVPPDRSRSVTPRPPGSPRSQWPGAPEYPTEAGYQGPRDIQSIADMLGEFALPEAPVRPPENHPRHPGLRFSPMIGGGTDEPFGTSHTPPLVPRSRTNPFREVSTAQNAVAVTWRGRERQTFALVTTLEHIVPHPNEGLLPIEVQPGTSQVVEVPGGWAGRVQRLTGQLHEPATYCELTFDGFKGMTFFNVSYVHGHNGPVLMYPWVGEGKSGSPFRAAQVAPAGATVRDSGGVEVVCGTVSGPSTRRAQVRQFYKNFDFQPAHHGAINPGDDIATQATHCRHIVCDFT